jgi:L-amino acid N-acyltransferase
MSNPAIRLATGDDLNRINEIYNYYVLHSTCTYQTEPCTPEERAEWFGHHGEKHPVTVLELDGQIVGWGALSTFRERAAYDRTVEDSVYLRHDVHRKGLGAMILTDLIQRARTLEHHVIIASIDGEQSASVALHKKLGFELCAHLREVGQKFDRWLDVVYMQLTLV